MQHHRFQQESAACPGYTLLTLALFRLDSFSEASPEADCHDRCHQTCFDSTNMSCFNLIPTFRFSQARVAPFRPRVSGAPQADPFFSELPPADHLLASYHKLIIS